MIALRHQLAFRPGVAAVVSLFALGVGLAGCSGLGDSMASSAFVDPAKYDLFDCKQLETERKSLATRTAEVQGLMAKAETGVGGAVVSQMAYSNDYIALRAATKLANEVWERDKCASAATAIAPPVAPPVPAANAKGVRSPTR